MYGYVPVVAELSSVPAVLSLHESIMIAVWEGGGVGETDEELKAQ